jgi:hypothetical protein
MKRMNRSRLPFGIAVLEQCALQFHFTGQLNEMHI